MKRFIAFSGGVESSAMCVLYGKDATPIFTDTGWEHKPMYERIDMMEKALKIIHGEQCSVVRIKPKKIEGLEGVNSLPDYIRYRKFYPNSGARFCTRLAKIEPMDEFLSQQGDCEVFIGLNADEEDDRVGNYGECKNVTYRYPLIEDNLTRKDCEEVLEKYGLLPSFPAYMERGGCVGCFYKRKSEYAAMALLAPEEAYSVADLEDAIQGTRDRHYHIHSGIKNMRQFIDAVRSQKNLFPLEEVYPSAAGQACGVFCHR